MSCFYLPMNLAMKNSIKSIFLDVIQFMSIIFFIISGPLFSSNPFVFFFQVTAIVIISLGVWEMRQNKFYRIPDIGRQEKLVTSGIYKYIRHPMYLSQLLFIGALLLNFFSYTRLIVFIFLAIDFVLKMKYEETLLEKYFKEYKTYKKHSYKLIPLIY